MAPHRRTRGQRFDGKVAVVTGASSGIGRSVALTLADRGAVVIGLARRRALLAELEPELARRTMGSTTEFCDVSDAAGYRETLARIEADRGRLDILVNNAGVALMLPVPGSDDATVQQVFDVNFFSTVAGTLAVVPGMIGRGWGAVVNVSSDSARAPVPGQGAYAASKAAISTFSESVALEVAPHGVHVHVLYPGWVPTAMGLPENEDGGSLPPKAIRRTAGQVATLVADRIGDGRLDMNAAHLPLLAPIARTLAPRSYQKAVRRMTTSGGSGPAAS
jgi:NAD(P)-dependent dehydrogenase (short-subunit alcohol dehydrogenase family)